MNLDQYIGKKVVITYSGGGLAGIKGFIKKHKNGLYTHVIMSLDEEEKSVPLLWISNLSIHKKYSWKPLKLKIG